MIVVIPCGARKLDRPASAGQLYTGPYFTATKRAALRLAPPERVLILSGKYGLLGLDDPIEPYEQHLGAPGSVTAAVVRDQAATRGLLAEPVMALCGRTYANLIRQVWPQVTTPLEGLGGMGHQLAALKRMAA